MYLFLFCFVSFVKNGGYEICAKCIILIFFRRKGYLFDNWEILISVLILNILAVNLCIKYLIRILQSE